MLYYDIISDIYNFGDYINWEVNICIMYILFVVRFILFGGCSLYSLIKFMIDLK